MDRAATLRTLIAADRRRMDVLASVQALDLPDCWVAAGFVRNCVWDALHAYPASPLPQDIDVIWFDPARCQAGVDAGLEARLRASDSTLRWSVKTQARMHLRNDDAPYASATAAMRFWPETATAVGVRLGHDGAVEIAAPFGLADLFDLAVKPGERFRTEKHPVYLQRIRAKAWQARWPGLKIDLAP